MAEEATFQDALLLGKRRIYEKTVQQGIKEAAKLGITVTREDVIKALSKQIPDLRRILGESH